MRNKLASTSLRVLVSSALVLGMVPTAALAEGVDEAGAAIQALAASNSYIVSPTECGTCWWSIDSEGTLVVSAMGGEGGGVLPEIPWGDYNTKVTSVRFEGTVKPTEFTCAFSGMTNLKSVDFAGLDLSGVTDIYNMFFACESLETVDFTGLDTSNITSMHGLFANCTSLESISLDGLDMSSTTTISGMFSGCTSLRHVYFAGTDTSRVTDMSSLFLGCTSLGYFDFSDINTSSVETLYDMFFNCEALYSVNLSGLDGTNLVSTSSMFANCSKLASIDFSGLKTPKLKFMNYMFEGCYSLVSAKVADFDTASLVNCSYLFNNCWSLADVDLSGLDTSNVEMLNSMFGGCNLLKHVKFGSQFSFYGTGDSRQLELPGSYWRSSVDKTTYAGNEIPNCVEATYTLCTELTGEMFSVDTADEVWTGEPITKVIVANDMTEGVDYEVAYTGNVARGFATITITGIGDYAGTLTYQFQIRDADYTVSEDDSSVSVSTKIDTVKHVSWSVEDPSVASISSISYTGAFDNVELTPNKAGITRLIGSIDHGAFVLYSYLIQVNPSTRVDISNAQVTVESNNTYTGDALTPKVTVKVGEKTLAKDTDYSVTYSNNTNVGTATVTITGKGGYSGTKTSNFTIAAADASKAVVSAANQKWTGKALMPAATVTLNGKTLKQGTDYTLSYLNNTKVGTATVKATFKGNYKGTATGSFSITEKSAPSVTYHAHVQNIGWQSAVKDGAVAGTSGKSLRVEALRLSLSNSSYEGSIQIRSHVQNIGWQDWASEGGTTGQSLRVEAMQIRLTGELAEYYDVYYRVHAQNYGWMGWAKNGEKAGTEGYSLRLEAIQVKLVPKGGAAPGSTADAFRKPAATVEYQAHVQDIGWQSTVSGGATAGTSGRSLRVEALKVSLAHADYAGGVQIRSHVQNIGWQNWSTTGGTTGQSLRVEAMQIRLTGEMAEHYDVYYRVHAQNLGWMGWAKNGEKAGTEGMSLRLEAIQVKLVPKGSAAPGSTANCFQKS